MPIAPSSLFVVLLACGADTPLPEQVAAPISPSNVQQLHAIAQYPIRAHRILRGPGPAELTLFDYNGPAGVIDANLSKETFKTLRPLVKDRKMADLAISRDGSRVMWHESGKSAYTVLDIASGKSFDIEIGKYPGFAAFSADGKQLAVGFSFWDPAAEGVGYSEMRLFAANGQPLQILARTGPGVMRPVYSPNGNLLAVGNRNDATQLFDAATGKLLHTLGRKMTHEIAFSPDNKRLAASYYDGTVAIWDTDTGKELRSVASGCKELYSVDWSPKGDLLATSGHKGKSILWDADRLVKLKDLDTGGWTIQIRFAAGGGRLLTSGAADDTGRTDQKVTVWGVD